MVLTKIKIASDEEGTASSHPKNIFDSLAKENIDDILSFITLQDIGNFRAVSKQFSFDLQISYTEKHCQFIENNLVIIYQRAGLNEMTRILSNNPRIDPSIRNNHAIDWASERGKLDFVQLLLKDSRVDPSDRHNYAIGWAGAMGNLKIVRELLKDSRVDPSDQKNYTIRLASEYGHLDVVRELLKDSRVDPSDRDEYAIFMAMRNGHFDVVKELLHDHRVESSPKKISALRQVAVSNGHW
eukprot:CAMPEP_0172511628 /NCGR_PEP_ID=MMETSP1066-20121228/237816_1 /TAXON_ID=671091 /ORGANISM="Coscinodiscus wailesii, Strain CCMP2513" /LENGTH=240 /DNA_ID=CAMNT_0013291083 /DNA_START=188 /DNA_END=907 /DNA_ORIENTATION=+